MLHIFCVQICPDEVSSSSPVPASLSPRRVSFDVEENNSSLQDHMIKLHTQLGPSCPSLVRMVKSCLHQSPAERSSSEDMLGAMQIVRLEMEGVVGGGGGCGFRQLDLQKVQMFKDMKELEQRIRKLEVSEWRGREMSARIIYSKFHPTAVLNIKTSVV